jgi:hypothetical protein
LGRLPSFAADESGHSATKSLNVGNLRDTGHSDGATPPAAMADDLPVMSGLSTRRIPGNQRGAVMNPEPFHDYSRT